MIVVTVRDGDRLTVNGQMSVAISRINTDTIEIHVDGIAIQRLEIDHPGSGKPNQPAKSEASAQAKPAPAVPSNPGQVAQAKPQAAVLEPNPPAAQSKPVAATQPGPQVPSPQHQPRDNRHNGNGHGRAQYYGHGRPVYGDTTNQYGRGRSVSRGNG